MGERRPIIVAGFYRSGTSLLRRLLDAHSSIHCGPEVKFFRDFFGDYRDDTLAHARLFSTLRTLDIDDEFLLKRFGRALIETYEEACRRFGKVRWADKNPENLVYADHWMRLLDGDLRFVHIVRDPLDAIASLLEIGFDRVVAPGLDGKLAEYTRLMDAGRAFMERNPRHCYQIRYEDLARSPEQTLQRLMDFLGEEFEPAVLTAFADPARRRGIEDPKVAQSKRIHQDSLGRERRVLSTDQRSEALAILSPYYRLFGYSPPE